MHLYGCGYNGDPRIPGIWLFELDEEASEKTSPAGEGKRGSTAGNKAEIIHMEKVGECAGATNPSYGILETTPEGNRVIYASCELPDSAQLAMFKLDESGKPEFRDSYKFEDAAGTCFVLRDPEGKCIYGANYNSGSICSCRLNPDGTFGEKWPLVQHTGHGPSREEGDPDLERQTSAHVHTLSFVPGTSILAAVDLGEDRIYLYDPDEDGRIGEDRQVGVVEIPSGCGPRIVAYHPDAPIACVVCELSCEAMVFSFDESGTQWKLLERHGLVDGHAANWKDPAAKEGIDKDEYPPLAAHAEFSADGRFLYVSTRGTNTITVFEVNAGAASNGEEAVGKDKGSREPQREGAGEGILWEICTTSCGGHSPRHFAISPDQGMLAVANQVSNEITVFSRNAESGLIKELTRMACKQPSCVIW